MLASLLFPYDDDAGKKIDGWIAELSGQNCIVRYKHDGAEYIQIEKWLEHQRIDKPSASKIPAFGEDSEKIREDSKNLLGRKGREWNGVEGNGNGKDARVDIPDWLPLNEWEAFKQMRIKAKKPMTPHAEALLIKKLEGYTNKGHDPAEVLNQSTISNWSNIYEPKENKNESTGNRTKQSPHDTFGRAWAQAGGVVIDQN